MNNSKSFGEYSFAANSGTAYAKRSTAFGNGTAYSSYALAEGGGTSAFGYASHAEGCQTQTGSPAIIEIASNLNKIDGGGGHSHAEGWRTKTFGRYSHAEGCATVTDSRYSHAEGLATSALGLASHVGGFKAASRPEDKCAYVWSGVSADSERLSIEINTDGFSYPNETQPYYSKGPGTFNVNPVGGLSGFYVGGQNLAEKFAQCAGSGAISAAIKDQQSVQAFISAYEISAVNVPAKTVMDALYGLVRAISAL